MFAISSINGVSDILTDTVLTIFLSLFTIITVFVGVWFIAANINKPKSTNIGKINALGIAWIIIVIGMAIRIAFSLITVGYLGINSTQPHATSGGLVSFYKQIAAILDGDFSGRQFYVLPSYLGAIFGGMLDLVGKFDTGGNIIMRLFIRLPFMLCDAAAALILFKIAKKYANSYVGVGLVALYMLCPVLFFGSSIWGSVLSVLALLLLLSFYFMTQRNFLGLSISYALAILTAREAVFFLPVFGVFYAFYFIKSLRANRDNEEIIPFKKLVMHKELGLMYRLPFYLLASLLLMYVFSLPTLKTEGYSFLSWFSLIYIQPFSDITSFGTNSFSVYNLFGKNNAIIASRVPFWIISLGFLLVATALCYVLYSSKKNRANMVLVGCYVFLTLVIYSLGFSEISLLPVLTLLLLAFILIKDKRILHIFGLLALIIVVNGSVVMMTSGYFANAAISEFATSTGTALLSNSGFGNVINIICSAVAMLTHLYFTLIVLDVSLSNRRMLFSVDNYSFGSSMKSWFEVRNK